MVSFHAMVACSFRKLLTYGDASIPFQLSPRNNLMHGKIAQTAKVGCAVDLAHLFKCKRAGVELF